ncbi:Uncharacterized conserved protein YbbC, DUF1343 family [Flexibacter flexilis DSM 6793]|uniref:Uncharacterized conserved protein YbbC, DUF1343 family n=1 Tax=Flexibacter flexilis DSM 6793 TaxID=927664 RepID=A0A1I1I2Z7_9BACT|nr:DUF1343 domain-containing protein [Flexibacter flexilis]SFC30405.1 Uncharacterized conserved protein YbbC, DUF1343 family [Flexibacter flexilis DSM 6793]
MWFCAVSLVAVARKPVVVGASQTETYLPVLAGKRVGCVVNHSSLVANKHLIDTLLSQKINIVKIFAPEHGFRGQASAGEKIKDATDEKTGLPIVSLYGDNKMPTPEQMKDLDIIVFDIQDVGARFYTYISTLHYVMQACAKHNVPLLVLDRPNPNGHYIDGPVLDPAFKSFVGMHPIPIVHGLTLAELAQMINGQHWLPDSAVCPLIIVKNQNYKHSDKYSLPVRPSPNLPNDAAIYLYPSLCLFEGTMVSVARGTDFPFQAIGAAGQPFGRFHFTPTSRPEAKNPPFDKQVCNGVDLRRRASHHKFTLKYLISFYQKCTNKEKFFNNFFNKLAGNSSLREQIVSGMSEEKIRETWQKDLEQYKAMRQQYLLYED